MPSTARMGRAMREYVLPTFRMFGMTKFYKHNPSVPDDDVTPEYLAENTFVVGSVETVVDKLEATYDQVGGFGHLLVLGFDYSRRTRVRGRSRCGCWPKRSCPDSTPASPKSLSPRSSSGRTRGRAPRWRLVRSPSAIRTGRTRRCRCGRTSRSWRPPRNTASPSSTNARAGSAARVWPPVPPADYEMGRTEGLSDVERDGAKDPDVPDIRRV